MTPVLVITGPVGAGKTSVLAESMDILDRAGVAHAAVDMDALNDCRPRPPDDFFQTRLALRNLAAVWLNYREAGAQRLILAWVIEDRAQLSGIELAIPGAELRVVRLRAPLALLQARLRAREAGAGSQWHQERAAVLAEQMERDALEDHLVENGDRGLAQVADEVLRLVGWLE